MQNDIEATAVSAVAVSWLAVVAALGSVLVLAVVGQGIGAVVGGCGWIGATVPLDRQVWALVNQPVLNYSSLPAAGGYWLGSTALPFLAALLLLSLRPRKPGLIGQFAVVQTVWWIAVIAGVWLPLLDPVDGHLSRWLLLHRLDPAWVWTAPAVGTVFAVLASLRLLEIARRPRADMGRRQRVAVVFVHLVIPVLAWSYLVYLVGGPPPWRAVAGLALPLIAVVVFGWFRFPPPFPRPLQAPSQPTVIALCSGAALSAAVLWAAGRPVPEGRSSGILWGAPESSNNMRPWIEPQPYLRADDENN